MLSIKSVVAAVSGEVETAETEPTDDHHAPSVAGCLTYTVGMLATIPNTIRDVLVHETRYTSQSPKCLSSITSCN